MTHIFPSHPVHSAIVETVTTAVSIDMKELHRRIKDDFGFKISSVTLYRYVSELIGAQVLLRYKRKISVNIVWLHSASAFFEKVKQDYIRIPEILRFPLRKGEKKDFFAESLYKLDSIWSDIHLELALRYKQYEWYGYNSHPYHFLGMKDSEARLHRVLVNQGLRYYLIFGNNTFLDRYGQALGKVDGYKTILKDCPYFTEDGYAFWTTGQYILECKFPDVLTRRFAALFQNATSAADYDPLAFLRIFKTKIRCKLTVRKDAREAERWLSRLKELF